VQLFEFTSLVTLLVIGYFAGRVVERSHYASIRRRERELADVLAFMVRFPFDRTTPQRAFLVHGTVVVSADYFKTFVAGLRNFFGGRLRTYETLMGARSPRSAAAAQGRRAPARRQNGHLRALRDNHSFQRLGGGDGGPRLWHRTDPGRWQRRPRTGAAAAVTTARPRLARSAQLVIMKLENRPPAEGINATDESPLRELAWLLAGGVFIVVALVFAVSLSAQWLAPRIPYAYEARLAASLPTLATTPATEQGRKVQAELQALADRLVAHIDLPEGMTVRVGYREEPVVNAFASVGGQTVFFRGLLEKLESEDALAMVMAHEIAHLKLRHATAALGRGVAVGVLLSVISTELGRSAAGGVLGQAGVLTSLSFNRDQEREADEVALRVIAREYGHLGGQSICSRRWQTCRTDPPRCRRSSSCRPTR
jgi:beta-barrel assembly-enhancing protease